ncbi:MAG: PAS domain S-box protein [Verrucomicrobia bacterium]|nr:PAS domain S-box protein [Verrucomicrobiota bacterium]
MNAPVCRWAWVCIFLSCLRLDAQTPSSPPDRNSGVTPITTTLGVQQLAPNDAAQQLPVKIRGIVTFSQPWWRLLFVQDDTGGIFCEPAGLVTFPPAGHLVDLEGSTTPGAYLPVVIVKSLTDLGPGKLPTSQPASAAQLWKGEFDGDLVQVSGHVASAVTQNIPTPFLDLRLISEGRTIQASVLGISNIHPATLLGSHVELQGVYGPKMNDQRKISGVGLLSAQAGMFRVISNANDIATTLPLRTVSDLRTSTNQLLRVHGIVVIGGTNDFWLADNHGGINVSLSSPRIIHRGDELEVLGVQNKEGRESRLSLLQILSSSPGAIPKAEKLPVDKLFDPHRHGQMIQTEGTFLHRVPSYYGDILVFREGERSFEARLRFNSERSVRMLAAGAQVRLTGVLRMQTADVGLDASPRVLIDQPSDLEIVNPAPLSAERLYIIASTLAALLGAGLIALGVAHRRLKDSTHRLSATESDLRDLNADLERRIAARTQELERSNSQLSREIAERKHTEQTLAENEQRFRLLVEQINTTVWEFDPMLDRMLYVSPQAARFGYAIEDWLTPGFWKDHIHPDDRDFAINFCVVETTKGLNHELQYRFAKADGSYVWIDDKVAVETRSDGSRLLRGVFIDITVQKEREEALRQSEERFAKAFHASPSIVVINRKSDARYLDVNERFVQVMGYTREEIIGRTSLELGIWVDPNQRCEIMAQLEAGQTIQNVECGFRAKSGARHTMLLSIETIVIGGESCLLRINNDITDLKKAESLRRAQNLVLEMIAQGAPLSDTLTELVSAIEAQAEGMLCSILLLSKDGKHLHNGAAPSLPDAYNRQIDGLTIGPNVGSCGTAAHFGEPVFVEDILTDPRWASFRDAAEPHGLRSCWSTPIFDAQHRLLGTFAIYYKTPGSPTEEHLRLIQTATHSAAICIRRATDEESLRESQQALLRQNALLNEMEELAEIGAWSHIVDTDTVTCSDQIFRIYELPLATALSVEQAMCHYPPRARPVITAAIEKAGCTGQPWDLELPFITAKGNPRWVRVQGKAELVEGEPARLHGSFQDITPRKRIEEALRSSEERFAKAFQLSPAITVITRRSDGRYIDVNARFTELLGYTREESLGRTSIEIGLWADPETRRNARVGREIRLRARCRMRVPR